MNLETPKVSVVVPIYGVEKYLRQCVDSILAQTLKDIEIILVDDGSPDACPRIVDEYAARDPRVVPVHQENRGLSGARNAGLDAARGEYVGFIDGDDWIEAEMFEKLYDAATANIADVVACGIRCEFLCGGADVDQAYYDMKFSGKFAASPELLEKLDVSVCNKIFRRTLIERAGGALRFPDGRNFEDCEFFWRFFLRAQSIFCIQENLYHYVRHGSGIMKETMTGANAHSVDAVLVCGNILRDLLARERFDEFAFPFFLLLAGHYGLSARSGHPETDSETRKILDLANYKKFRRGLPERENWAWEILDGLAARKKFSLGKMILHTKNCKGVSRTFLFGIRIRKKRLPEVPAVVFASPQEPAAAGTRPKISVVVPTYNAAAYLRQSLDALCGQTLRELEIVCVNDGSTDESEAILREYAERDPRVKIISKANGGYGSAVNVGIDAAEGEFLAVAEPDDYVAPDMFATLYAAAKENHVPLVKCDWELFWENAGTETRRERWRLVSCGEETVVFPPKENPTMIADASGIWAAIYDLAWLRANGIRCSETSGASFQDTAFVVKTYFCAGRMAFVPRAFVSYRQTNPNSSINAGASKAFAVFGEFDAIVRFCEERGIWDDRAKALVLKKMHATGKWNLERFSGDVRERVKRELKKHFRGLLKFFSERPPEIAPSEWAYILEIAERRESFARRAKSLIFEESFGKNCVRVKLCGIRVLKTPTARRGKDSAVRKIVVRMLAALFFSGTDARRRFRARHLNLDPRFKK